MGSAPLTQALVDKVQALFPNAAHQQQLRHHRGRPDAVRPASARAAAAVGRRRLSASRHGGRAARGPVARRGRALHAQPDAHGGLQQPAGEDRRGHARRLVPLRRHHAARRQRVLLFRRPRRRHVRGRRRECLARRGRAPGRARAGRASGAGGAGRRRDQGRAAVRLRGAAAGRGGRRGRGQGLHHRQRPGLRASALRRVHRGDPARRDEQAGPAAR